MIIKLSNLTSNFRTHNKVGDKLWTWLYIGIYITYILKKYKEIWRTLLIPRPTPSHQTKEFPLNEISEKLNLLKIVKGGQFSKRNPFKRKFLKIQARRGLYENLKMFYLMGWGGWDGVSKVSFKFLYTLWVYR